MAYQYDPISPIQPSPALQGRAVSQMYDPIDYSGVSAGSSGVGESQVSSGGASVIAALGSMLGSIVNYFAQKKLQKQQQEFQKEMYDYTFDKESNEYWNRVAYDTPAMQMARLKAAGLNENLMYGTLGNAAGVSGNAPSSGKLGSVGNQITAAPFFDSNSVIQNLLTPVQLASQVALNKSQSYKNYKDAGYSEQAAERLSSLTPMEMKFYEAQTNLIWTNRRKFEAEINNLNLDAETKVKFNSWASEMYQAQVMLLDSEIERNYSLTASQVDQLTYQTEHLFPSLASLYTSEGKLNAKQLEFLVETWDDNVERIANETRLSKKEANNYFWGRLLPQYLNVGANVFGSYVNMRNGNLNYQSRMNGNQPVDYVEEYYSGSGKYKGAKTRRYSGGSR